jgi:hypothetical protein
MATACLEIILCCTFRFIFIHQLRESGDWNEQGCQSLLQSTLQGSIDIETFCLLDIASKKVVVV